MCTIDASLQHTPAYEAWADKYGDDVRELREDIAAGTIDFSQLEMVA